MGMQELTHIGATTSSTLCPQYPWFGIDRGVG